MCRVTSCCFFFPLRVGTLIASAYTMLLSVVVLVLGSWLLASGMDSILDMVADKLREEHKYSEEEIEKAIELAGTMIKVVYGVAMVIYAVWFITAIFLIVAVNSRKRGFLMPWIVWTCILTGLAILGLFNEFRNLGGNVTNINIISIVVSVITVIVNIFALCGVNSYYKFRMEEPDETAMSEVAGASYAYNRMKV